MIYTEYFVKGTQPTTVCPLHESPSLLDRLAGVFGKDARLPVGADAAASRRRRRRAPSGNAPAATATDEQHPKTDEHAGDEPKKKTRLLVARLRRRQEERRREEGRRAEEAGTRSVSDDEKKPRWRAVAACPFASIAGHRHLLELLPAPLRAASLPPSLIFAGPDGVGKRRAAVALAQLLNCHVAASPGWTAVGRRRVRDLRRRATRIARGVHARRPASSSRATPGAIKVDQVRDAIEQSAYRPFEGRRRVVIVDEADALLVEAQNALLKTLEEPPPASVFVLVTSRPDVLLPTVRVALPAAAVRAAGAG